MVSSALFWRPRGERLGGLMSLALGLLCDKRGSAAVSFGFGIPVVLSAIFGTIELGRLGFTQAALQYAAEEATRYAIVRTGQVTTQDIETYAASKLDGVFDREECEEFMGRNELKIEPF